jgi:phospholipid/cholesterol/gamma-HCH transport system substrate-binding protein
MTTTKQQKIRIGLFAVISGALLGLVLVVFGGLHFWRSRHHYTVVFAESVYGLESGAEVYLNGVRVGSVDSVRIDPTDIRHVRVTLEVDDDTPVRADTRAYLQIAGITGLKVIDLRGGSPATPALVDGSTIPVGEGTLDKLEQQASTMADQASELMTRANHIVERADSAIDQLVGPLGTISTNLAHATAALDATIRENRTAVRTTLADISGAAREVGELVPAAGDVITQLHDAIRNDNAQLHSAMVDIRQASRTFKDLAREVRQKPSRLLFSSPAPDRKLP